MVELLEEQTQGHSTRRALYEQIEEALGMPVVAFFTSFKHPVMLEDDDCDMLEGVLQRADLTRGLALFMSSPGGDGLAAERIINACRSYSGTGKFTAIVPGKAKSAATMVCFGASKIVMGATSELGPIDPQLAVVENNTLKRYSVYNLIESYTDLFSRAVKEKGNLEPYIMQLQHYDERDIKHYREALKLSEDIAIRSLASGMMKGVPPSRIKKKIAGFLTPKTTKDHARPIYQQEALQAGLEVETHAVGSDIWKLACSLHTRLRAFVSVHGAKIIESRVHSFVVPAPPNP